MTKETEMVRSWGYSKTDAQVFERPKGEGLPKGYYDSPAKIPADKPKAKPKKKG